jgi:micrococcal nuclease
MRHPLTGPVLVGILLIAATLAAPIQAQARSPSEVSGLAHVVDGDTIHLAVPCSDKVVKVRLQGVAAPERSEAGGAEATRFVEQLAEGREVRCELDGSKSKDRVVGVCFVGGAGGSGGAGSAGNGQDIGAAVIEAGLARDCPRFSGGRYKALEKPEAMGLSYPSYCVPRQKSSASAGAPSATEPLDSLTVALYGGTPHAAPQVTPEVEDILEHGGGLNGCGCHFNRKTGECHCHRGGGCGCACEAPSCSIK